MAQHRSEIDLVELEKLCQLQCTDEEIAAWFNISTRTIVRRRQEPEFAEVMLRGKAKGRIFVRRMQMKLLEQGNATMAVWLGKQMLGQKDQVTTEVRKFPPLRELSPEELNALLKEHLAMFPELAETMDAEYTVVEPTKPAKAGALVSPPKDGQ